MAIQQVNITAQDTFSISTYYLPGRQLVRDRNGRLHAVWGISTSNFYLYYAYSDDDGASWSSKEELTSSGSWTSYTYSICVDDDDEPVVFYTWYQATGAGGVLRRESGVWTGVSGHGLTNKLANQYGANWIGYDHANNICHLLFGRRGTGSQAYLEHARSEDDFVSYESIQAVYSDASANRSFDIQRQFSAEIDESGNVHVVYVADDGANYQVYYNKWSIGTKTWGTPTSILSGMTADAGYLGICVDPTNGYIHVVGTDTNNARANIWHMEYNGSSWSSRDWATTQGAKNLDCGLPGLDGLGQLYLVQGEDNDADPLAVMKRTAAGSWSTVATEANNCEPANMLWDGSLAYGRCASGWYALFGEFAVPDHIVVWYDDTTVFGEEAGTNVNAAHEIIFAQEATLPSFLKEEAHTVVFGSSAAAIKLINRDASHTVIFGSQANLSYPRSASSGVVFGSEARKSYTVDAASEVQFSGEGISNREGRSYVVFGGTAVGIRAIRVSAETGVVFGSTAAHLPLEGCETDYSPDPSIQESESTITRVYFQGPWSAPTRSLMMRKPEFGNVDSVDTQTEVKRSRSGERRVYYRSPVYRAQILRFDNLSRKKAEEVKDFFVALRGQEIRFIDHESRTWRGHVLNRNIEVVFDAPDQGASFSLEFEGETVSS